MVLHSPQAFFLDRDATQANKPVNPLRFALLGRDPLFDPLLAEISASPHEIAWTEPPGAEGSQWEELLLGDVVDVVLVGRGEPTVREDQLRRLVQAAIPTVVAHPGSLAPLFCYELDMICRENGCVLLHYYPGEQHPAVLALAGMWGLSRREKSAESFRLGEIEQITFERHLERRDRESVLDQLARDIDLLITIADTQTKVLALASGEGEKAYSGLNVQFTGTEKIVSRWSVLPGKGETSGRMIVTGKQGRATLEMPADSNEWRLSGEPLGQEDEKNALADETGGGAALATQAPSEIDDETPEVHYGAHPTALARIVAAVQQQRTSAETQPASAARIGSAQRNERWFQACQSIDLLEAVERSIAKGRTVELHFEDYTSEATFKGRMSAIGCAILMLGLMTCMFGFVSDLFSGIYQRMLGKELPPPSRWWPWLLLAGLVAFLVIQVLPKLFPEPEKKAE